MHWCIFYFLDASITAALQIITNKSYILTKYRCLTLNKSNVHLLFSYYNSHKEPPLYSFVIILFQWSGINSLFVRLNGGFMIDVKGLQTHQCHKAHQIVRPFAKQKEDREALALLCDSWIIKENLKILNNCRNYMNWQILPGRKAKGRIA